MIFCFNFVLQGDSGGPLFVKDTIGGKSKYVIAGLTSYGDGCGLRDRPGIYARVSAFLDWIQKNK
jgi:secreted trypsin-like serine protease